MFYNNFVNLKYGLFDKIIIENNEIRIYITPS